MANSSRSSRLDLDRKSFRKRVRDRGGYLHWPRIISTVFNIGLATILLILGMPLLLGVGLLVFLTIGRPIFYRGERMGLQKKPFIMYKFRTLPLGAQQKIGSRVVTEKDRMTTPLTRFLRDTRLDELPQLFNIFLGHMDFIGPRPLRPEQYEAECRNIPNYDVRFSVKPGLIGYSQLFTPHSTPKKIRARFDGRLVARPRKVSWVMCLVLYTMAVVAVKTVTKGVPLAWRKIKARFYDYRDLRALERISLKRVNVRM